MLGTAARDLHERRELHPDLGHVGLLRGGIPIDADLHLHHALVQAPLLLRQPGDLLVKIFGF